MAHNLHARAVGLIAALVLGIGGAVGVPNAVHAADPGPLGINLSGLTNVTTTIDNTTGSVTGTLGATLGSNGIDGTAGVDAAATTNGDSVDGSAGASTGIDLLGAGNLDNTVDGALNTAGGAVNSTGAADDNTTNSLIGTVDNVTDVVTGEAGDDSGGSGSGDPVSGVLDGVTGVLGGGSGIGTGNLDNTVDGALNTAGGAVNSTGAADDNTTNSLVGTVDNVTDVVTGETDDSGGAGDPVSGALDGVTGVLGGDTTDGVTSSLAGAVGSVASIPVDNSSTVGSSVDDTADSATATLDPAIGELLDSCVNVPPAGVSVDLGDSCGGGSGILDPITTAVSPLTDPLANLCLSTVGVDAEAGTTCDGSGSGNLPGSLTGIIDQGTGNLAPLLNGLSLSPIDTQPVNDGVNQVINPLDVCAGVNPINFNEELGAGCDQSPAPCTALNVNCLLSGVTDSILGAGGLLDPVVDSCLGYDPVGFNLDIGSACAASAPPTTCPPDCGSTCPPDCGSTCPPDCGSTCPPDCGTTCPPDCGSTCPPDCGTTCPPDCGPPVCTMVCGPFFPICPPNCGPVACPPSCGITDNTSSTGNTAEGGTLVIFESTTGTGTTGSSTTAAHPPAAPLSNPVALLGSNNRASALTSGNAVAFAPPTAGDAGLLDQGWGDASQPIEPVALFTVLFIAAIGLRRRYLHD